MRIILLVLALATAALAQTTVNLPNSVVVNTAATDALNKWLATQANSVATTLKGAISSGATALVFASGAGIAAADAVLIDGEVFLCSAKAGASFTCAGAQFGTAPALHADGAAVTRMKYPTIAKFFVALIKDTVASIMDQQGSAKDAYQTAITNAKATLDAAKTSAVQ